MFYPAEFLNPVSVNKILPGENLSPHQVGAQISCLEYEPETPLSLPNSCQLVLIGVPEYRGAGKTNQDALKQVRKYYYRLIHIPKTIVCDLGDLKIGHTPNDTHFALRQVLEYLISNQKNTHHIGWIGRFSFYTVSGVRKIGTGCKYAFHRFSFSIW